MDSKIQSIGMLRYAWKGGWSILWCLQWYWVANIWTCRGIRPMAVGLYADALQRTFALQWESRNRDAPLEIPFESFANWLVWGNRFKFCSRGGDALFLECNKGNLQQSNQHWFVFFVTFGDSIFKKIPLSCKYDKSSSHLHALHEIHWDTVICVRIAKFKRRLVSIVHCNLPWGLAADVSWLRESCDEAPGWSCAKCWFDNHWKVDKIDLPTVTKYYIRWILHYLCVLFGTLILKP